MHNSFARSARYRAVGSPAKADRLQVIFATALALHRAGRLAEAIRLYKRVLSRKPDLPEPHNNLGAALAGMGRQDEAVAAYRRAIELNPNNAETHANLGHSLRDLGMYEAAEQSFRRAIPVGPDNVEAHSGLGTVLMDLGRPAEAEESFRRAIALKRMLPSVAANPDLVQSFIREARLASHLRHANVAQTFATFTQQQVLQQAGVQVLKEADATPQQLLALFQ